MKDFSCNLLFGFTPDFQGMPNIESKRINACLIP